MSPHVKVSRPESEKALKMLTISKEGLFPNIRHWGGLKRPDIGCGGRVVCDLPVASKSSIGRPSQIDSGPRRWKTTPRFCCRSIWGGRSSYVAFPTRSFLTITAKYYIQACFKYVLTSSLQSVAPTMTRTRAPDLLFFPQRFLRKSPAVTLEVSILGKIFLGLAIVFGCFLVSFQHRRTPDVEGFQCSPAKHSVKD
jgi:hypothetical protein